VKDVLAYARVLENPKDDAAFLRIANVPTRGVGDRSLQRVRDAAGERGVSCLEAVRAGVPGLSSPARKGLGELVLLLDTLGGLRHESIANLLEAVAHRSGYLASLADAGESYGEGRRENVEALLAHARQSEEKDPGLGLREFLERTALVADQDAYDEKGDGGDRVHLMSVHAAKGLEFPFVVIAGADSESFPHVRSVGQREAEEEERRLFYVAMTRAMERLVITWAATRVTYTGAGPRHPTPYLKDVPDDAVRIHDRSGYPMPRERFRADDADPDGDDGGGASFLREAPTGALAPGARVRHPVFGDGDLRDVRGSGAEVRVTVDFDAYGEKTLLLQYAHLERIP
jgi:DNA helicase-2/ATP-dependent DNA helicase PcrA